MNTLEAEYSFLAPTWRLPTVATSSIYSRNYGTSYLSTAPTYGPDWSLWSDTSLPSRYIPTYIPPSTTRRAYGTLPAYSRPIIPSSNASLNYQNDNKPLSEDGLNLTISLHPSSEYDPRSNISQYNPIINRELTYATPNQATIQSQAQKRRVQIADRSRPTPSTHHQEFLSDRQSRNSNGTHTYSQNNTPVANKSHPQSKSHGSNQQRDHDDESRHGYNPNQGNIHDYLYGLATPDPGSYVNTFKQQQRRLQEEKQGRKSVITEYKNFAQNGGFGPPFTNDSHRSYQDKVNSEQKKKHYANFVRKSNQQKIEEPKQRNDALAKAQRARAYAESIEKPHNFKPVCSTYFSIQVRSLSSIKQTSLFNTQFHSNTTTEVDNRQFKRSLLKRKSRIHIDKHRSNSCIDLPSRIIGIGIPRRTRSLVNLTRKTCSTVKIQCRQGNHLNIPSEFSFLKPKHNHNGKKSINKRSMNMRLPPTATVFIQQANISQLKR